MRNHALRWKAILIIGLALSSVHPAAADPWPRFRGPNGTGSAADKDVPVTWTSTQGVLWKATISGRGNSSPVVWGEHLFVQSASDDGRERVLLCLDTRTGKVLWTQSNPGSRARTHPKNTLASSTPATDGERVYALFWDGKEVVLAAYDFQGKLLWSENLGPFTSQHGAGASPVVWKDKVFLNNDQDGSAVLVAFDAKTGKRRWETPRRAFRACYSAPFVLERPGHATELIVASTADITSYDPDTAAVNWNWQWHFERMPLRTVASPVYSNGMILANSGDGGGDRLSVAVRAEGRGDVTATNLVWQRGKGFPYVPTMLARDDYFFFVNDTGVASCRAIRTGAEIWSERLGGNVTASPILVDDKIYAINEDGIAFVFRATPRFELLARTAVGEPVMATPALADNRLYIRGQTHLYCIGRELGVSGHGPGTQVRQ